MTTPVYSYRIANQITTSVGTGTISAVGTALTGSGTSFISELNVGDVIHVNGETLVAATRTSDTVATLVTAPSVDFSDETFTITALADGNLETLGLLVPRAPFKNSPATVVLGNGLGRNMGRPSTSWLWNFTKWQVSIANTHRDLLRTFCPAPAKSARVYICTKQNDNSDAFVTYDAIMDWPDEEKRDTGRRLDFQIDFRGLIAL